MLVPMSLLQQEIVEAFDKVARKYNNETPEEEKNALGITAAMRAIAKTTHQSFEGQFSKYTAITNSKLGD
jgi:3-methyladenine DNA glycosylase AlkC